MTSDSDLKLRDKNLTEVNIAQPKGIDALLQNPQELSRVTGKNSIIWRPSNAKDFRESVKLDLKNLSESDISKALGFLRKEYPTIAKSLPNDITTDRENTTNLIRKLYENYDAFWHLSFFENSKNSLHVITAPTPSNDPRLYANIVSHGVLNQGKIKSPIPGTGKEWEFLITLHEAEHITNQKEKHQPAIELNKKLQQITINQKNDNSIKKNLNEIDSDIAMYARAKELVTPEVLDFYIAIRIFNETKSGLALHFGTLLDADGDGLSIDEAKPYIAAPLHHNTSFHLLEYAQTGELSGYYNINEIKASTFLKITKEAVKDYQRKYEEQGLTKPKLSDKKLEEYIENLNQENTMGLIENLLKRDPPVLDPTEQMIAQGYLDSMKTLGLKATDYNTHLKRITSEITKNNANNMELNPTPK